MPAVTVLRVYAFFDNEILVYGWLSLLLNSLMMGSDYE